MGTAPTLREPLAQRVLITGAAHGIGRAVAVALAEAGGGVALADIDADGVAVAAAEITAAGGTAHAVPTNVTQRGSVDRAVAQAAELLGGLEGLVVSAGGFPRARAVEELSDDEWHGVLDVNLYGAFACARAVFPHLRAAGGGSIVCVSSEAGRMPSWLTAAHYVAAKSGMLGLVRHLAREGGRDGIRVNAVAPGTTMTERVAGLYSPEHVALLESRTPLGRLAGTSDQVGPILFLLSQASAYMTGATLDVNGGRIML